MTPYDGAGAYILVDVVRSDAALVLVAGLVMGACVGCLAALAGAGACWLDLATGAGGSIGARGSFANPALLSLLLLALEGVLFEAEPPVREVVEPAAPACIRPIDEPGLTMGAVRGGPALMC